VAIASSQSSESCPKQRTSSMLKTLKKRLVSYSSQEKSDFESVSRLSRHTPESDQSKNKRSGSSQHVGSQVKSEPPHATSVKAIKKDKAKGKSMLIVDEQPQCYQLDTDLHIIDQIKELDGAKFEERERMIDWMRRQQNHRDIKQMQRKAEEQRKRMESQV